MPRQTLLPAEWAPQAGIMFTWPHPYGDWRPWLEQADDNFTALAAYISRRQGVLISCYDKAHLDHVKALLVAAGAYLKNIRLYVVPSNDSWARDHGPIIVYQNGQLMLLNFRFNGWGGKFAAELDNQVTERLHALGAFGTIPLVNVDLILEGGSIEADGQGTLLTTRRCLLSATRNGLSRQDMERRLTELLGIERFLWLNHGHLLGDDTDSHIDTLARFCDPETIAYQACEDPSDEHFASLHAMEEELKAFRSAADTPYRLVPLPLPGAKFNQDGKRLPAGYANFLIINGAVLVPTYDDPADKVALDRLRGCFLEREVVGMPCLTLIQQYGSLHCVTMQLPEGVLPVP